MSQYQFGQSIEVHYPTTVLERDFIGVEGLNQRLRSFVLEWESAYRNTEENAARSGKVTTQGGYQTSLNKNLFELANDSIAELKKELVLPAVAAYLQAVFKEEVKNITPWLVGWANVLRKGNWQRPHFHPTERNLISGVYYVDVPEALAEPDGCIEFINPVPISVHHGFSTTRRIKPKTGKLILFPPYYMHYVHPFVSEKERIIIAFDVIGKPAGPKFVF